eukprot:15519-Heterococcus_DN1.PRE.4
MFAPAQKRSAASSHPLNEHDLLHSILSYKGPGHWRFLATVNSLWREVYAKLKCAEIHGVHHAGDFTCVPKNTLYSAVFESVARVAFAHVLGVDCNTANYQAAAGAHADIKTLKAAHALGMQYTEYTVCHFAAERGHLEALRWAREHGRAWNERSILSSAVSSGSVEVTAWVKQHTDVALTSHLMTEAAARGHTAVC